MAKSSALPILIGGGALLLLSSPKKKRKGGAAAGRWGVAVSDDCQTIEITDPELFRKFIVGAFNELLDADAELSVLQYTDALFGDVAPNCSGFPERPESGAVAELYAMIARAIGKLMILDARVVASETDLVDEATQISFGNWYRAWRNYPSSDVPVTPEKEVAFSSDFTDYEIGPAWYEETIKPFVTIALQEGRGGTAYEEFIAMHGVLVGQFVQPISELPEDNDAVEDFLDKLEEAIDQAVTELGG